MLSRKRKPGRKGSTRGVGSLKRQRNAGRSLGRRPSNTHLSETQKSVTYQWEKGIGGSVGTEILEESLKKKGRSGTGSEAKVQCGSIRCNCLLHQRPNAGSGYLGGQKKREFKIKKRHRREKRASVRLG